jgi:hypothetical protein
MAGEAVVNVRFGAQLGDLNEGTDQARTKIRDLRAELERIRAPIEIEKLEGQIKNAGAASTSLTAQLNRMFEHVSAPLREMLDGFAMLGSRMRETAEIAGVAFVVDKLREYAEEMGELGEHAVNTAAALGMTAEQYQTLSESMEESGGSADALLRTQRQLASASETAVSSPLSRQADAFRALGIDAARFAETLRSDPIAALKELADKYKENGGAGGEAGPFGFIVGRNLAQLIPYLKDGSEGIERLQADVKNLGAPAQSTLEDLDKMGESFHRLEIAATNFKIAIADLVSGPLTSMLNLMAENFGTLRDWAALLGGVGGVEGAPGPGGEMPEDTRQRYTAARGSVSDFAGKGANNKDQIKAWLYAAGYTDDAVAAILGNAKVESGFNPGARNASGHFGLFQWDKQRQRPLGGSTDISTQMELMDRELAKLDPAFRTATGDVAALTTRFERTFIRSGGQENAKRVAAAEGSVTVPDVGVTAKAPGSPGFANSAEEKRLLDEKLKNLEAANKATQASFDYEIAAAKGNEEQQSALAQQKAAADQKYFAQRKALIEGASAAVRSEYADEGAGAVEAATRALQAQQRADDANVAEKLRALQQKLRLDEQSEASDLRLAEGRARLARQTATELAGVETGIVRSHEEAQQQILADEATVATGRRKLEEQVAAERTALEQKSADQIEQINLKAADKVAEGWQKTIDQISTSLSSAITDVLTGTKTMGEAFKQLGDSILKDFINSSLKSVLGGSGSGGGSSGISGLLFGEGGLGGLLGLGSGGLLGAGAGALGLSSGAGGLLGSLFGGGVNQDFAGGINGAGQAIESSTSGGGLLASLFSGIGSLFAFAKGGIVPSAAGGWSVPQLSGGSTLAQLHSNEMVLPENISQGLQGMIANGGGSPAVNANFSVSAMDSQSVSKFFQQNGSLLVASINKAMRNGAALQTS